MHFKEIGYKILKDETVDTSSGLKGQMFLAIGSYSQKDYGYLTAIYVKDKSIYTVEAAGLYKDFKKHEANLLEAIKSFEVN